MDPEQFESWVQTINSSAPGDQSVQKEIETFLKTPCIISVLFKLLYSNRLSDVSSQFALYCISSIKDLNQSEKNSVRSFFKDYTNSNLNRLINSQEIIPLSLIYCSYFTISDDLGQDLLNEISLLGRTGLLFVLTFGSHVVQRTKLYDDISFLFKISIETIELYSNDIEILGSTLCIINGILQKVIKDEYSFWPIDNTLRFMDSAFDRIMLIFDQCEPPISSQILQIILCVISLSPPSFPSDSFRNSCVTQVVEKMIFIFDNSLSHHHDFALYVQISEKLCNLIFQYGLFLHAESFFISFLNVFMYVLRSAINGIIFGCIDLFIDFWTKQDIFGLTLKHCIQSCKKKIRSFLLHNLFSIDSIPKLLIRSILEDKSSMFIHCAMEIMNQSDGIDGKIGDSIRVILNYFDHNINTSSIVEVAFSLIFISEYVVLSNSYEIMKSTLPNVLKICDFDVADEEARSFLYFSLLKYLNGLSSLCFQRDDKASHSFVLENYFNIESLLLFFYREMRSDNLNIEEINFFCSIPLFSNSSDSSLILFLENDFFHKLFELVFYDSFTSKVSYKQLEMMFLPLFKIGFVEKSNNLIGKLFDKCLSLIEENVVYFSVFSISLIPKNLDLNKSFSFIDKYVFPLALLVIENNPSEISCILKFIKTLSFVLGKSNIPFFSTWSVNSYCFIMKSILIYLKYINEHYPFNSIESYHIVGKILRIVSSVLHWPHISVGIFEFYGNDDLFVISSMIIQRLMFLPMSSIYFYVKPTTCLFQFLSNILKSHASIFHRLDLIQQRHILEILKFSLTETKNELLSEAIQSNLFLFKQLSIDSKIVNDSTRATVNEIAEIILDLCFQSLYNNRVIIEILFYIKKTNSDIIELYFDRIIDHSTVSNNDRIVLMFNRLLNRLALSATAQTVSDVVSDIENFTKLNYSNFGSYKQNGVF